MDTGKKLWKVDVHGMSVTFNVIAKNAEEAARVGLQCAREEPNERHIPVRDLRVTSVDYEGTLDRPSKKRKG